MTIASEDTAQEAAAAVVDQGSAAPDMWHITAFYRFVRQVDLEVRRERILTFGRTHGLVGTILLAPEGINATVAGTRDAVQALLAHLRDPQTYGADFADLTAKFADASQPPFVRFKVKLKSEIVTLRAPEADPNARVGTYVTPEDWNALIARPDVTLVDTRNRYEVALGTFRGALDPQTKSFTDFKRFVAERLDPMRDRSVAMFCTGGIRCEKATSYLLAQGFSDVFHLEGGILRYLEEVPAEDSRWEGSCFVFDERVGVGHGLIPTGHVICEPCGWPVPESAEPHARVCGCATPNVAIGQHEQPSGEPA